MRALLTTAMLCAAVTAAAQSHEPAVKTAAKPAPLVSRITAAPKPTPPAADHGAAEVHAGAAAKGKAKPLETGATAPVTHAASPAAGAVADAHVPPAAPAAAKTLPAKGPVQLASVHGRLTAALAGLHGEPASAHRPARATPRYVVSWPAARWRVAWRDDADRIVISWPE